MPERTIEISSKQLWALVLALAGAIISLVVYIWTDHLKEFEECQRIIDVLAGGNPY